MVVQVIQGQVSDATAIRAAIDRWVDELASGATGWLGLTGGVTDDGQCLMLARFESEEAARRNSDRPEQGRWWSEIEDVFTGEPTFRDTSDVVGDVVGDPDQAGFVQIMQGKGTDPQRAQEIMSRDSDQWAAFRPDILGSLSASHEGGEYTMALYFTSEAAAREGERKEPPPELKAQMEEMQQLSVGEPAFFDLKQPWLVSAR